MTAATTATTAATEQFVNIAQRSQEATTAAVRSWTETVHNFTESFSAENPLPRPADVQHAVDAWFDLANVLLAEQRSFARTLVDAGASFGEQARTATAAAAAAAPRPATATDDDAPKRARAGRTNTTD